MREQQHQNKNKNRQSRGRNPSGNGNNPSGNGDEPNAWAGAQHFEAEGNRYQSQEDPRRAQGENGPWSPGFGQVGNNAWGPNDERRWEYGAGQEFAPNQRGYGNRYSSDEDRGRYGSSQWGAENPNYGGSQLGRGNQGSRQGSSGAEYGNQGYGARSAGSGSEYGGQGYGGSRSGSSGSEHSNQGYSGARSGGAGFEYGNQGYGGSRYGSSEYDNPHINRSGYGSVESGSYNFSEPYGSYSQHPGRAPKGYARSDERIREDVCDRLAQSNLDAGEMEVEVNEGEVELKGSAPNREIKHAAERIAASVFGVKDVNNHLRIQRETQSSSSSSNR